MSISVTSDEKLAFDIGCQFLKRSVVEATPILGKGRINHVFIVRDDASEIIVRINDAIQPSKALDGFAMKNGVWSSPRRWEFPVLLFFK